MKKNLAILVIMLLVFEIGFAQNEERKFTFGPKFALNFTEINFNSDLSTAFDRGFDAGIFMRAGGRFYGQLEVYYSIKNNTLPDALSSVYENLELKTHYLQIPLTFGVSIINQKFFKLRVFVGPSVSFLLKTNSDISWTKNFYYGAVAGVGFDIWRFTLDAGYNFMLSKYLNQNSVVPQEYLRYNLFTVALGFKCY